MGLVDGMVAFEYYLLVEPIDWIVQGQFEVTKGMLLCDNCLWLDKSLYERDVEGRIYTPPHNSREHEPHASSIVGDETRGKANTDSVIPPPAIVSRLSAA